MIPIGTKVIFRGLGDRETKAVIVGACTVKGRAAHQMEDQLNYLIELRAPLDLCGVDICVVPVHWTHIQKEEDQE